MSGHSDPAQGAGSVSWEPGPGIYTSREVAERTRIPVPILRWLAVTEGIDRKQFGHCKVWTPDQIRQVQIAFRLKDPGGRFLVRPERANGPRKLDSNRIPSESK